MKVKNNNSRNIDKLEEIEENDIYIKMPPISEKIIKVRIRKIENAIPRFVEPED